MFHFIDKTAAKERFVKNQLGYTNFDKDIDGSYTVEHTVYDATVTSRNQTTTNRSIELLKFVSVYRL